MHSLVMSIFLYACESWTITAELQRRIQAMKMRCYHKILNFSYKDHVTNKAVHAKIQQLIGPHKDLLTTVKRCKLQWYGHVFLFMKSGQNHLARHSERGKKTRQTKEEVEDNIKEWTGLEFAKFQSAVENREKWRELVVKSSVVP